MKPNQTLSWKEAFFASPGPNNLKEAAGLTLRGVCMGSADIIPGVSGGTIALITGIYDKLLLAIKSANVDWFRSILRFDIRQAVAQLHIRFLISLFLGIGAALISLARLMNYLLHHHPVHTWSLFFGLIAASILVVGKTVEKWSPATIAWFFIGIGFATLIVNMIPVSTPETMSFVFFSGLIAICAMILPGISGAFILLILGKYEFITACLKNPFLVENMVVIVVFCAGCLIGLLGFSRVLSYLLDRYHAATLAFLTGLMAGSLQKIWPWKEVTATKIVRGKVHVLSDRNVLPAALEGEVVLAIALVVTGFIAVLILEKLSQETKHAG